MLSLWFWAREHLDKRQWAAQGTDAVPEIKDKWEAQEAGKKCKFIVEKY